MNSKKRYEVATYDAHEYPVTNGTLLPVGKFDHAIEAIACAKKVIDDQLMQNLKSRNDAQSAVSVFLSYGEWPLILGNPEVEFDSLQYAKMRSVELEQELNGS